MLQSQCNVKWEIIDFHHSTHFLAVQIFQIASCPVSLLNNIWVRVEHSLSSAVLQELNLQKVN